MKDKWEDITIDNYQELTNVTSEGVQRSVDIISILTDKDSDEIRKLPLKEFMDYNGKIGFISTTPDSYCLDTFELNGVKYGKIPDLDFIMTDEWIDIETWKDNSVDNMHLIMAVLYRPVTIEHPDGTYEIEPHQTRGFLQRADLFREQLSITKAMGAQIFFSLFALEYLTSMQGSLTDEKKVTKPKKTKKTLKKKVVRKASRKNN